jgi:hypothetical protein
MRLWRLQGEFNDIFNACNLLHYVFFERVLRAKNHVMDHLTK